jgi:peptidoglycan/LPS O-acetylase OafA/YrhL
MDRPDKLQFMLRYSPVLDGIRGIAVLAVMLVHMPIPFGQWGYLGVDVFFTLSGFLITAVLLQEWVQTGSIDFGNFYARRALRLLPALSILLAASLLPMNPLPLAGRMKAAAVALLYSANWVRAFDGDFQLAALGHTWSLSIEEQFYLLWPLALIMLLRYVSSRGRILSLLGLAAIASLTCRIALWMAGASPMRLYNGLDTRADSLLAGCMLSVMLSFGILKPRYALKLPAMLAICILVLPGLLMIFRSQWSDPFMFLIGYALAACTSAAIIFVAVGPNSGWLKTVLSFPPLVWIGKVSYGVYLWHYPVFKYFQNLGLPPAWKFAGMLAFVFMIAALSYYGLEKPFLRMKQRFQTPSPKCTATIGS